MTCEQYVLKNWKNKTAKMMAEDSGFSVHTISEYLKKHKITPVSDYDLKVNFVLKNCGSLSVEEMAKELRCGVPAIKIICDKWDIACMSDKEKMRLKEEKPTVPRKSFWDRIKENGVMEWKMKHSKDDPNYNMED